MPVEKSFETASARMGHVGPLLINSFTNWATADTVDALDDMLTKLSAQYGHVSIMTVMGIGAFRTDDFARTRAVNLAKKWENRLFASAIVIRTQGLGGVVVRTFFSSFFMLTPSSMKMFVFRSIDDGLHWLVGMPPPNPLHSLVVSTAEIEAFVHQPGAQNTK